MKRMTLCVALVLVLASAAVAQLPPIMAGWGWGWGTSHSSKTNSYQGWDPWRYTPKVSGTVNKVRIWSNQRNGTIATNGGMRLELIQAIGPGTIGQPVTYDDATDKVLFTGHPLADGDTVAFTTGGVGVLPAGMTADGTGTLTTAASTVDYTVCNKSANAFQISTDACATVVVDFSGSSGVQHVRKIVQSTTTTAAGYPNGGWVEFTGLTAAVTRSTPYWFVVRNLTATPMNNYIFMTLGYQTVPWTGPFQGTWVSLTPAGIHTSGTGYQSNTSGVTVASAASSMYFRVELAGPIYEGLPFQGAATGDKVYDKYELGMRYPVPANTRLNVNGIGACFLKIGAPATGLRFRLYVGANGSETLLDTTDTIDYRMMNANFGCYSAYFSSAHVLQPGTIARLMMSPATAAGDTSNYYGVEVYGVDNDANSTPLIGAGVCKATNDNSGGGISFTYQTTSFIPMYFTLVQSSPLAPAQSGGSYAFVQ